MLGLSNTRTGEEAIKKFIEEASKAKREVIILFVSDDRFPKALSTWLLYMGFLGVELTEEVKEVLRNELKEKAIEKIEEIKRSLAEMGIPYEVIMKEGNFFEKLREVSLSREVRKVIVPREKEVLFGRIEKLPEDFPADIEEI